MTKQHWDSEFSCLLVAQRSRATLCLGRVLDVHCGRQSQFRVIGGGLQFVLNLWKSHQRPWQPWRPTAPLACHRLSRRLRPMPKPRAPANELLHAASRLVSTLQHTEAKLKQMEKHEAIAVSWLWLRHGGSDEKNCLANLLALWPFGSDFRQCWGCVCGLSGTLLHLKTWVTS